MDIRNEKNNMVTVENGRAHVRNGQGHIIRHFEQNVVSANRQGDTLVVQRNQGNRQVTGVYTLNGQKIRDLI